MWDLLIQGHFKYLFNKAYCMTKQILKKLFIFIYTKISANSTYLLNYKSL